MTYRGIGVYVNCGIQGGGSGGAPETSHSGRSGEPVRRYPPHSPENVACRRPRPRDATLSKRRPKRRTSPHSTRPLDGLLVYPTKRRASTRNTHSLDVLRPPDPLPNAAVDVYARASTPTASRRQQPAQETTPSGPGGTRRTTACARPRRSSDRSSGRAPRRRGSSSSANQPSARRNGGEGDAERGGHPVRLLLAADEEVERAVAAVGGHRELRQPQPRAAAAEPS